ncbi:MAG: hypothetical protein MZW92_14950 [Comamonadaceae bacterium]|nr:hypothetical protein [Comamonadaceae bacterium]
MGFGQFEALLEELDDHRAAVSRHFEAVFADPGRDGHVLTPMWNGAGDGDGHRGGTRRAWATATRRRRRSGSPPSAAAIATGRCRPQIRSPPRCPDAAGGGGRRRDAQPGRDAGAHPRPARSGEPARRLPRPAAAVSPGTAEGGAPDERLVLGRGLSDPPPAAARRTARCAAAGRGAGLDGIPRATCGRPWTSWSRTWSGRWTSCARRITPRSSAC